MRARRIALSGLLFLLAFLLPVAVAVEQPLAPEPTKAKEVAVELKQLVADLDHHKFRVREDASRKLAAAGKLGAQTAAPVDALVAALDGGSAEVFWRGFAVLELWCKADDPEFRRSTIKALEQLKQAKNPVAVDKATDLLTRMVSSQHHWAVSKLRQFGAQLSSGNTVTTVRLNEDWQGGDAGLVYLLEVQGLTKVLLAGSNVSNDGIATVVKIPNLNSLYLSKTQIDRKGLEHLQKAPNLTYLSLKGLQLGGDDLEPLAHLGSLEQLGLDETLTDDQALTHLENLSSLKTLWLNNTKVTDDGMVSLAKLQALSKLILTGNSIEGRGLKWLGKIKSLRYLSMQHVQFADEGMQFVEHLTNLETFGLDDTQIGDAGLVHLEKLVNLKTLWLTKTNITQQSVESLKKLKSLSKLYIKGTMLSEYDDAIEELKQALPECRITH